MCEWVHAAAISWFRSGTSGERVIKAIVDLQLFHAIKLPFVSGSLISPVEP